MTTSLDGISWLAVVGSALFAAAVSPLLAGWSAALADGQIAGWWRPRRVSRQRALTVAVVATVLGALAAGGRPWPIWWLFAVGGAVLAVVDAEVQLLPSRFVYPLAGIEVVVLATLAPTRGQSEALVRAALAATALGGGWLILAFIAGGGIGLGDSRLAALTGAPLGWLGWPQVMQGELFAVAVAGVTAVVIALVRPIERRGGMRVPLGPALVVSTLFVAWT